MLAYQKGYALADGETERAGRVETLVGLFTSALSAFARLGQVDEELLSYSRKAIEGAFTLFPSEEIAFQIALDAALNVRQLAYDRERYKKYSKGGKSTKVLLARIQMFQQMIWLESQKWEKYQETDRLLQHLRYCDRDSLKRYEANHNLSVEELSERLTLSEINCYPHSAALIAELKRAQLNTNEMLARYLKFLVQETIDNNSSYVALAISHMVYDYSLPRVMDISALLSPDPLGGQYLYRLKSKLVTKIKNRFSIYISFSGEGVNEHFEIQADPDEAVAELVKESLGWLTPWKTDCLNSYPSSRKIAFDEHLSDWLEEIADDNQREMGRSHVVVCPNCYEKLISGCRVKGRSTGKAEELPPAKLGIPRFHLPALGAGGRLSNNMERVSVAKSIRESSDTPGLEQPLAAFKKIVVFVDGEKQGECNADKTATLRLSVDEDAKLIKVMARDDERRLLLATLLINRKEIAQSLSYRVLGYKRYFTILPGGEQIRFSISAGPGAPHQGRLIIDIAAPAGSYPAISSLLHTIASWLARVSQIARAPRLLPVHTTLLIIVATAIIGALYLGLFHRRPESAGNAHLTGHNAASQSGEAQSPAALPGWNDTQKEAGATKERETSVSRSNRAHSSSTGLSSEKKELLDPIMSVTPHNPPPYSAHARIYIESFGDEHQHRQLRELIISGLRADNYDLTEEREQAQAILQGTLKEINGSIIVDLELVDESGKVLLKRRLISNKGLAHMATQIARYLLQDKRQ